MEKQMQSVLVGVRDDLPGLQLRSQTYPHIRCLYVVAGDSLTYCKPAGRFPGSL